jgi:hypothetical protein
VIDIFSYDLVEAFRSRGCPLCRVIAVDERRWVASFWREGKQAAGARRRFFEGGGFCRTHAWLLYRLVAAEGAGAAIADLYGALADRDLDWLAKVRTEFDGVKRRRGFRRLKRGRPCSACAWLHGAVERKVAFFLQTLGQQRAAGRPVPRRRLAPSPSRASSGFGRVRP